MSHDSSSIKIEVYSIGKAQVIKVDFVHLKMWRYITN